MANNNNYCRVRDFYYSLIESILLIKSIEDNGLYIGKIDGHIVSCMVVNHEYNDGYKDIQWSVEAKDSELFVIHALGVDPMFSGKGIAKQMVRKVIGIAYENNIKTIRLDVLGGNIPAESIYTKMGFVFLDTIR